MICLVKIRGVSLGRERQKKAEHKNGRAERRHFHRLYNFRHREQMSRILRKGFVRESTIL